MGLAATLLYGAGATFPYPMFSKWFNEYNKLILIFKSTVSRLVRGGIKQVTEGTVDFGASDGPMNDDQIKEFASKRGSKVLRFPTVLGADVPTYNVPGVYDELNLIPASFLMRMQSSCHRCAVGRRIDSISSDCVF